MCFRAFITKLELRWSSVHKDVRFKEMFLDELVEKSKKLIRKFEQKTSHLKLNWNLSSINMESLQTQQNCELSNSVTPPEMTSGVLHFSFVTPNARWLVMHCTIWGLNTESQKLENHTQDTILVTADAVGLYHVLRRSVNWTLLKSFLIKGNLPLQICCKCLNLY